MKIKERLVFDRIYISKFNWEIYIKWIKNCEWIFSWSILDK